ncbi:unnamed protein product, partial [Laminaria digitata]
IPGRRLPAESVHQQSSQQQQQQEQVSACGAVSNTVDAVGGGSWRFEELAAAIPGHRPPAESLHQHS